MSRSIYVISSEPGPVKIGIATAVKHRFSTLVTASSVPLSLDFVGECDAAAEVEARAHAILRPLKTRGEWFNTPVSDAIAAVMQAAGELGYEIRPLPTASPRQRSVTPKDAAISIRLSEDVKRATQLAARDARLSVAAFVILHSRPSSDGASSLIRRLADQALKAKR